VAIKLSGRTAIADPPVISVGCNTQRLLGNMPHLSCTNQASFRTSPTPQFTHRICHTKPNGVDWEFTTRFKGQCSLVVLVLHSTGIELSLMDTLCPPECGGSIVFPP
jgi:hypothetical protein